MRLLYLAIDNFKNLRDFSITFDGTSLTTVIIGRNGTGKSNLLEALILIFRDLDLGEPPQFKYQLDYLIRGYEVTIDADPARSKRAQVRIKVEGEPISYQHFSRESGRLYLPSNIFGYYSGPSNRMEEHFDKHQERFYHDLLRGEDKPLRPLLYARLVHSQFVLLSFFNEQDERIRQFLKEHLGIEDMDSVLFVMRQPSWNSKEGDHRFWKARGVVQRFLDRLYRQDISLAPLRLSQRINLDFNKTATLEHLYLYLPDKEALNRLYSYYNNQQEFFKALESTYISEILSEVRIRVKVRNADGSLTFRDLSEGEQQLLMVLGLLRFTRDDEALFLLDEPDTHLNPIWGIQYLDFLHEIVGEQDTSHIIMSTHNPLVISSLEREQVQIMQRDDETGRIFATTPEENPRGMGVAAILTSDLFGLRSTLDLPTQRLVDERRLLAVQEHLSSQDKLRLEELNEQLENLDFSITLRDSLYEKFVKAITTRQKPEIQRLVSLTPEQQEEQRQLVLSILQELQEEEEEQHN